MKAEITKSLQTGRGYQPPPADRRCAHLYEDGRQCKAWRSSTGELCSGHGGVSSFTSESGRAAQVASQQSRQRRAYARKLAALSPRALTADDVLRVRAAEEAVTLADHMLAPLDDPKLGTKAKAEHAAWVQDRARPDLRPDVLAAMTLESAKARLASSPDPRTALGEMSDEELDALTVEGEAIEIEG